MAAVFVLAADRGAADAVRRRAGGGCAAAVVQLAHEACEVAAEHGLPVPAEVHDAAVRLVVGVPD